MKYEEKEDETQIKLLKQYVKEVYEDAKLVIRSKFGTMLTPKICKRICYNQLFTYYLFEVVKPTFPEQLKNNPFTRNNIIYITNIDNGELISENSNTYNKIQESWEQVNIEAVSRVKYFHIGTKNVKIYVNLYYYTSENDRGEANSYLERGIDKYVSKDVFDKFKDIYSFTRLDNV